MADPCVAGGLVSVAGPQSGLLPDSACEEAADCWLAEPSLQVAG